MRFGTLIRLLFHPLNWHHIHIIHKMFFDELSIAHQACLGLGVALCLVVYCIYSPSSIYSDFY
jgi:hypothetical protein